MAKFSVEKEYTFALEHPTLPPCKQLLAMARLYTAFPDEPSLVIIQASAEEIRNLPEFSTDDSLT